jgi:hypothetical protein
MNCEQFLESLDALIDGELAGDEASIAEVHRRQCPSCGRAVAQRLGARQSLRRLASAVDVPAGLEERILQSVTPWWRRDMPRWPARSHAFGLLAIALVFAVVVAVLGRAALDARAANTLDRVAINVDESSAVVIRGTLLCRDCELTHRYGIESSCQRIGHHGALFTDGGVILNLVEQRSSARLIHDESLFGKQVVVHGRLLRGARALSVESFEIQG